MLTVNHTCYHHQHVTVNQHVTIINMLLSINTSSSINTTLLPSTNMLPYISISPSISMLPSINVTLNQHATTPQHVTINHSSFLTCHPCGALLDRQTDRWLVFNTVIVNQTNIQFVACVLNWCKRKRMSDWSWGDPTQMRGCSNPPPPPKKKMNCCCHCCCHWCHGSGGVLWWHGFNFMCMCKALGVGGGGWGGGSFLSCRAIGSCFVRWGGRGRGGGGGGGGWNWYYPTYLSNMGQLCHRLGFLVPHSVLTSSTLLFLSEYIPYQHALYFTAWPHFKQDSRKKVLVQRVALKHVQHVDMHSMKSTAVLSLYTVARRSEAFTLFIISPHLRSVKKSKTFIWGQWGGGSRRFIIPIFDTQNYYFRMLQNLTRQSQCIKSGC